MKDKKVYCEDCKWYVCGGKCSYKKYTVTTSTPINKNKEVSRGDCCKINANNDCNCFKRPLDDFLYRISLIISITGIFILIMKTL